MYLLYSRIYRKGVGDEEGQKWLEPLGSLEKFGRVRIVTYCQDSKLMAFIIE
jgi:hypothetical protein